MDQEKKTVETQTVNKATSLERILAIFIIFWGVGAFLGGVIMAIDVLMERIHPVISIAILVGLLVWVVLKVLNWKFSQILEKRKKLVLILGITSKLLFFGGWILVLLLMGFGLPDGWKMVGILLLLVLGGPTAVKFGKKAYRSGFKAAEQQSMSVEQK